ncbi:hypothetical protein MKSMC1_46600 [Mycobacterium kansasii]|nr:hypothetical protein MKSMC1_46600 [Mycobacterium kansasii]
MLPPLAPQPPIPPPPSPPPGTPPLGQPPIPPWASPPPPPSLQATREAYNQLINDIDHHMEIRPILPIGTRFRLITKKPGITTP